MTMEVEEVRQTLIEVVKHLENYTDRELIELKWISDKMKEMALYEEFRRERETDERH